MKHQETTSQQYNFSIIKHGDISTPQGFTAGGMHIGLRANKKDFGWITHRLWQVQLPYIL
ncbi:arginine biosynthesis ArgJ [Staphylococcus aureus DAR1278]|nr:arginine biosynthesis ArgJ [Staphylococcus aureus DAR1278]